jgi:hypothetical protein
MKDKLNSFAKEGSDIGKSVIYNYVLPKVKKLLPVLIAYELNSLLVHNKTDFKKTRLFSKKVCKNFVSNF